MAAPLIRWERRIGLICLLMPNQQNHKTALCKVRQELAESSVWPGILWVSVCNSLILWVSVCNSLILWVSDQSIVWVSVCISLILWVSMYISLILWKSVYNSLVFSGSWRQWWPGHGQWLEDGERSSLLLPPPRPPARPARPGGAQQAAEGAAGQQHHPPDLLTTRAAEGSLKFVPLTSRISSAETSIPGSGRVGVTKHKSHPNCFTANAKQSVQQPFRLRHPAELELWGAVQAGKGREDSQSYRTL